MTKKKKTTSTKHKPRVVKRVAFAADGTFYLQNEIRPTFWAGGNLNILLCRRGLKPVVQIPDKVNEFDVVFTDLPYPESFKILPIKEGRCRPYHPIEGIESDFVRDDYDISRAIERFYNEGARYFHFEY